MLVDRAGATLPMQPVRMSSGRGGRLGVMWLLEGCSVIDPHVELLLYEFIALGSRHDYSQAAVWQGDVADFDCRLNGGRLDARPTNHYPDTASARLVLEPYLHAWPVQLGLGPFDPRRARPAGVMSVLAVRHRAPIGGGDCERPLGSRRSDGPTEWSPRWLHSTCRG